MIWSTVNNGVINPCDTQRVQSVSSAQMSQRSRPDPRSRYRCAIFGRANSISNIRQKRRRVRLRHDNPSRSKIVCKANQRAGESLKPVAQVVDQDQEPVEHDDCRIRTVCQLQIPHTASPHSASPHSASPVSPTPTLVDQFDDDVFDGWSEQDFQKAIQVNENVEASWKRSFDASLKDEHDDNVFDHCAGHALQVSVHRIHSMNSKAAHDNALPLSTEFDDHEDDDEGAGGGGVPELDCLRSHRSERNEYDDFDETIFDDVNY